MEQMEGMVQPQGTTAAEQAAGQAAQQPGQPAPPPRRPRVRPVHALVVVIVAAVVVGALYIATGGAASPMVANGYNVSVYYTGSFTNGTVFSSNFGGTPLNFTVGSGQIISGFNNALIGMRLNQTKNITLTANEAYGQVNQSLIVVVPKSQFGNQTVEVGNVVTTSSGRQGIITAVGLGNVTVDFNPSLAGKTLMFEIKVVGIRK